MSDLSWLNPTPHAIAVYASRPLSPVATQHSLPSGRYPLLGPDFHRLDRTSLRLAHSLSTPSYTDPKVRKLARGFSLPFQIFQLLSRRRYRIATPTLIGCETI